MSKYRFAKIFSVFLFLTLLLSAAFAQEKDKDKNKKKQDERVRTMTIPISIYSKQELKQNQAGEILEAGEIVVREDDDEEIILSIKSVSSAPMSIAVLIQDDLTSNANLQLKSIADFIRGLPKGSRVMVAYLRGGSIQVRQKFTDDLEKAAKSLRIITGSGVAASSPYVGVAQALERFDALPAGRRAVLLVSDGLDTSAGGGNFSATQSPDLDRSILKAQRKSVAIYSFYNAATLTENGNPQLILNAQSALKRLSEDTGGRAFFQGTISPISFDPFFSDLNMALSRQFALTYLSTHMKKGYHKVQVTSTNPEIRIEHPKGYYYR
jgi:VWFA-related protein